MWMKTCFQTVVGFFSPPVSSDQTEFVMSVGHGCLRDMAQDWNADEALVVAGSLPLALTAWLFLSNSSSEEARCFSCSLEQEVFQEFELLMSCFCSFWVLYTSGSKKQVQFEICVGICKSPCCTVSILRTCCHLIPWLINHNF